MVKSSILDTFIHTLFVRLWLAFELYRQKEVFPKSCCLSLCGATSFLEYPPAPIVERVASPMEIDCSKS